MKLYSDLLQAEKEGTFDMATSGILNFCIHGTPPRELLGLSVIIRRSLIVALSLSLSLPASVNIVIVIIIIIIIIITIICIIIICITNLTMRISLHRHTHARNNDSCVVQTMIYFCVFLFPYTVVQVP